MVAVVVFLQEIQGGPIQSSIPILLETEKFLKKIKDAGKSVMVSVGHNQLSWESWKFGFIKIWVHSKAKARATCLHGREGNSGTDEEERSKRDDDRRELLEVD